MSTLKFIRTTHTNGRFHQLSPDAQQFWQGIGGIIGSLLRPETPLTLSEVVTAYTEYLEEHPETTTHPTTVPHVTWYLFQLVELDLAAIVTTNPLTHNDAYSFPHTTLFAQPQATH